MGTQGLPASELKEKKENIIIAAVMIAIAAVLAVISWFTLPDLVETQPAFFKTGVAPLPKIFAVLFPFGLTTFFAVGAVNYRKQFAACLFGYVLYVIFWMLN